MKVKVKSLVNCSNPNPAAWERNYNPGSCGISSRNPSFCLHTGAKRCNVSLNRIKKERIIYSFHHKEKSVSQNSDKNKVDFSRDHKY